MADWTNIPDTSLDPDAPLTSELAYAWRDNPIAISEGAAGAPKIQDAALSTGPSTAAGRSWVQKQNIAMGAGTLGKYALLLHTGTGAVGFGAEVSASLLQYSNAAGVNGPDATGVLWRCCGQIAAGGTGAARCTLFERIS